MDYLKDIISEGIQSGSVQTYVFVLVAGIITSFTPCVYPVIPIITGYIGARQVDSRREAFLLSLFYVIGMAVTFSALGIMAASTGMLFGDVQSNPWTHIVVGNVILIMSLWFLGIINMPVPSFRIPGFKQKGLLQTFILGLVSGIIAAPCTAAVLVIILSYVGTKQNMLFGGTLLFTYAMGLGTLIIIAGTFTGAVKTMIKSGQWPERIKKFFGIAMLFLAEYFFIQAG